MEEKVIGSSFSSPHLRYLNINIDKALDEFKNLGLKWMRVGCYWRDIEKTKGTFDFEELNKIVKFCEKNKIKIILTIGMKAPRYPEYYFPKWLEKKTRLLDVIRITDETLMDLTLNFLTVVVNHYKSKKIIKIWQVENEPLDPAGEKYLRISREFLEKEVLLVRKLDKTRKIMINVWGNDFFRRKWYLEASRLADIVGLDIYLKVPIVKFKLFKRYSGPGKKTRIKQIVDEIKKTGKEVMIGELQAEPWEFGELVTENTEPQSFRSKDFERNIEFVSNLGINLILLWGFEYWLKRKEVGDVSYYNEAKRVTQKYI